LVYNEPFCPGCDSKPKGEMIEQTSVTQAYKQGEMIPAAAAQNLAAQHGEMLMTTTELVLERATETQLQTMGAAWSKEIDGFGELKEGDVQLCGMLSNNGFIPTHFNVIHGGLFLNISGRRYWARRSMGDRWGGCDPRGMNAEELARENVPANDSGAIAEVYEFRGNTRFVTAIGYGRAGESRDAGRNGNPLAKTMPMELARKRAEAEALIKAAPLGVDVKTFVHENEYISEATAEEVNDDLATLEESSQPYAEVVERETQVSIDVSAPESEPRSGIKSDDPILKITISNLEYEGFTPESIKPFKMGNSKGSKAVIKALEKGWSPRQMAELIRQQESPPEEIKELPWA